jgi:hypothetical protein
MIGDMSPPISYQRVGGVSTSAIRPPPPPDQFTKSLLAPSVRGFKIAENQSPIPQDRVFFGFNFYDDVSKQLNKVFESQIKGVQIYRYT